MAKPRNPNYEYDDKGRRLEWITCGWCQDLVLMRVGATFCSKRCSVQRQHAEGLSRQASGEDHYAWKGSKAGYQALHKRVMKTRGSADHCEQRGKAGCRSIKYEWAHVHGTDPGDPANYRALCKECHIAYDGCAGGARRLTFDQAEEVRARYFAGGVTQRQLAGEFGVSPPAVNYIVLGKTYQETSRRNAPR